MPIKARYDKKLKKWVVLNTKTKKIHGKHPNKEAAQAQMAAMAQKGVDMSGEGEGGMPMGEGMPMGGPGNMPGM